MTRDASCTEAPDSVLVSFATHGRPQALARPIYDLRALSRRTRDPLADIVDYLLGFVTTDEHQVEQCSLDHAGTGLASPSGLRLPEVRTSCEPISIICRQPRDPYLVLHRLAYA
jgi:hypothetical protein